MGPDEVRPACQSWLALGFSSLRRAAAALLADPSSVEVLLFGSLARGDWDARFDVALLAVAADQAAAERLAEALRGAALADDVIALSYPLWQQRQSGKDPLWRGICRDAIRLAGGSLP
jgi:hypothetical protein